MNMIFKQIKVFSKKRKNKKTVIILYNKQWNKLKLEQKKKKLKKKIILSNNTQLKDQFPLISKLKIYNLLRSQ